MKRMRSRGRGCNKSATYLPTLSGRRPSQCKEASHGLNCILCTYNLSGGKEKIKQRRKAEPLAKPEALQTALAGFKRRMRKVVRHNAREEDEKFFQTSYARENRLKKMAVQNKHAAITGLPNLPEAMAKEVRSSESDCDIERHVSEKAPSCP